MQAVMNDRSHAVGEPHKRHSAAAIAAMAVLSVALFWIYGARPLVAEPWQWADDGLYLRQAEAFVRWLHGAGPEWLGPYDPLILTKAPLFAVWMAILYLLHLPLRPAEFALLLSLPWLLRAAVRPLRTLTWWELAATSTLLSALPFLPAEQRLLRTAFFAAMASGCQIAVIGLILRARRRDGWTARWAALSGLLFALAYLTREESIWLLPMLVGALAAILAGTWSDRSWRTGVSAAAGLLAAAVIPVALVSALNYHSYGIFLTTSRRAPEFTRAHQVMTSLEPETRERYVPIPASTRLKAYKLSPSFARLRSYLEGPATDTIATHPTVMYVNDRPPDTREFFVFTFGPVLQEAAFQAGAHTARESEALFRSIARELESAIALGWISAGSRGPAILAAPLPGDSWLVLSRTVVSLRRLYGLEGLMKFPVAGASSGSVEDRQRMENMTHMALAPTSETNAVSLPEVGADARHLAYSGINGIVMVTYAVTTAALLAFIIITALHHRRDPDRVDQAFVGVVLGGTLLAFSAGMAVIDVMGFSLLRWPVAAYNNMGYAPLSVLSAFGLVVMVGWLQSPQNGR